MLWWLLFHRHPRWTTWLIGVVPFLVVLFVCYMYVERLLPSNY
jgi:quinol-cytochrome oxidoreductase complex cytochrome b subunit